MPDSRKYLLPEVLSRIARLDLRARHVVEGFLAGQHRSPYFGQSVEFAQHRPYVVGDDLRHVDWKVWARQDRLHLKQYEEDTNLRCQLLVDGSHSMRYAGRSWSKFDCAATIAASLAFLALHQQDAVGCSVFDARLRTTIPVRSRQNHLQTVVSALAGTRPEEKTRLDEVLRQVAEATPWRGLMVLVSDLLVDPAELLKGLKLLRQRRHDVLVLHVLDDDELDFDFQGPVRFEGLESADRLTCNPRALRDGYLAALREYLEKVRRGCSSLAVDYTLIRTSQPLDAVLVAYLNRRLGALQRS